MVNDVQAHTLAKHTQEPMRPSPNTKSNKEMDSASMASVSTFRSTVSLLKGKLSSKDREASKEAKAAADRSTVSHDGTVVEKSSRSPPKDPKSRKSTPPDWNARARTAEAYMVHAMMK